MKPTMGYGWTGAKKQLSLCEYYTSLKQTLRARKPGLAICRRSRSRGIGSNSRSSGT